MYIVQFQAAQFQDTLHMKPYLDFLHFLGLILNRAVVVNDTNTSTQLHTQQRGGNLMMI